MPVAGSPVMSIDMSEEAVGRVQMADHDIVRLPLSVEESVTLKLALPAEVFVNTDEKGCELLAKETGVGVGPVPVPAVRAKATERVPPVVAVPENVTKSPSCILLTAIVSIEVELLTVIECGPLVAGAEEQLNVPRSTACAAGIAVIRKRMPARSAVTAGRSEGVR